MKKNNIKYLLPMMIILFVPVLLILIKVTSEFIQLLFNADAGEANVFGITLCIMSLIAAIGAYVGYSN